MKQVFLLPCMALLFTSCIQFGKVTGNQQVNDFLNRYNLQYQQLRTQASLARWQANIEIIPGDSTNEQASQKAAEKFAAFTGSIGNIDTARLYLEKNNLTSLQKLQLQNILYQAGNNPELVKDAVAKRIRLETEATSRLFGFTFTMDGKPVSPNTIDQLLNKETDLSRRLQAWQASKEVGKVLKDDLARLQHLRNETVQALGYKDYFNYQVADYGMTTDEMMQLNQSFIKTIWPLYREIHTYFRYELANRYATDVPDYLPAHWLPNRWGQSWEGLVEVKGANLDSALKKFSPEEIIRKGEDFYVSLGYLPLPQTFYSKSNLYPYPPDSSVKKNNHASAWHINLQNDLRSLMSVQSNARWWQTTHHELGHIFYYQAYSRPEIPMVLRKGANRAYHEAIGSLIGLASMQLPYLKDRGILPQETRVDSMQKLLSEALDFVVFLPWSAGVMTEFEKNLYADGLPELQFNSRWWDLKKKYQGIVPPAPRGEEFCDAATKTHIINDAAQYYDYAISFCLLMQLHMHIAKNILHQNPHATNYYGNKAVGDFLRSIMKWGQAKDWRAVLQETTGEDLNAGAMMEYFEPLHQWLKQANTGRDHALPEQAPE